ncbi:hypothetical protein KIN20_031063 [Parelaphostrongylus tenuis]|uniref:Uncharacterized protein n=1 Tax=Parelaphostrongylus tenuis TaxID=148309 RepID=A0AAD5WGY5_PARTN|nr:hypothetical protein KIN20_031063 [Parelaphostrongylus tenuis]
MEVANSSPKTAERKGKVSRKNQKQRSAVRGRHRTKMDPAQLVARARGASPGGDRGIKREPKATVCFPETQVDSGDELPASAAST